MKIKNNQKYFFLNSGCFVVKGSNSAAIYDVLGKKIYSLEIKVAEALEKLKDISLEEFFQNPDKLGIDSYDLFEDLKKLKKLRIGDFYPAKIYIDKLRHNFTKDLLAGNRIRLLHLTCQITGRCTLDCSHCQNGNIPIMNCMCTRDSSEKDEDVSINEWINVLKDAALFGCQSVRITGGDPLIYKDNILDLLTCARKFGFIYIELFTPGGFLTNKIIESLKKNNITLVIPFYSLKEEIHDSISGIRGHFKKNTENISKFKRNSINVKPYLLIQKANQNSYEETENYFKKMELESYIDVIKPVSNCVPFESIPFLSKKIISLLTEEKSRFSGIDVHTFYKNKFWNPCLGFRMTIKYNGDVLPCLKLENDVVGNIRNEKFQRILIENRIKKYMELSKEKVEVCKDCEFRYVCHDCRAAAKIAGGNIDSRDYFCRYDPYSGKWKN